MSRVGKKKLLFFCFFLSEEEETAGTWEAVRGKVKGGCYFTYGPSAQFDASRFPAWRPSFAPNVSAWYLSAAEGLLSVQKVKRLWFADTPS